MYANEEYMNKKKKLYAFSITFEYLYSISSRFPSRSIVA